MRNKLHEEFRHVVCTFSLFSFPFGSIGIGNEAPFWTFGHIVYLKKNQLQGILDKLIPKGSL